MAEVATEVSRFRNMSAVGQPWQLIARIFLIAIAPIGCFFVLDGPSYLGWLILKQQYFAILLTLALPCVFLLTPPFSGAAKNRLPWYDTLLAIASFGIGLYLVIFYPDILRRLGVITPDRVILGTIAIILIIEAVRRLAGWMLASLGVLFILYAYFNWLIPGAFGGMVIPWPRLANYVFLDENALLGIALEVTALIVLPFILFGNLLHGAGGGTYLTNLALAVFGRFRGGPAKVAVVASSLFGTISGSAVANVATTGVVTIPLMKRTGYRPHIAGAIESVSSTGGQLMPPIMGAAAFVLAEFVGVPYARVALAAVVPAIIYYIGIFIQVDLEAARTGLKGLPREQLPSLRGVLGSCYLFAIPLAVLVLALFVLHLNPGKAALLGVASILVISPLRQETRTSPRWLLSSVEQAGRGLLELTSIVAMAGFIIGVVTFTGLGFLFPLFLGQLAGGNLFLLLVIVAGAALILGMGMPTVAVYVLLSLLLAPALTMIGVPKLAAHLFILYWGILAMITPPVCLASFAAAAMAGASFWPTGYSAMRIGILIYIVPFLFVLAPALVLIGTPMEILWSTTTAICGSFMVGVSVIGYLFKPASAPLRLLMGLAGLALLIPVQHGQLHTIGMFSNPIGGISSIVLLWREWQMGKRLKTA